MKKIAKLSEGQFLKVFFAFLSACFLIAAVCMPDRDQMFTGLLQIVSLPSKISANYFSMGGFAATFLNMGLVCLLSLGLFILFLITAIKPDGALLKVIRSVMLGLLGQAAIILWFKMFRSDKEDTHE